MFAEERVQNGRQLELDIVRGLSVFLMVGAHVFNQFTPLAEAGAAQETFSGVSNLVGAFPGGAQCFMMVMGMLILFSTSSKPKLLMKRGLMLIVAGFVVELIRVLPGVINFLITGNFVSFFPEYSTIATAEELIILTIFWQDILIFAGMAFVFIGLIQHFKISDKILILITVAIMIANIFLAGMDTGNDALNIFLGYFYGTFVFEFPMTTSRFPFFSWIIYPVAGYILAKYLVRAIDKDAFYKKLALWCLAIAVPLTVIGIFTGMFNTGFTGYEFYHQELLANLWCTVLSIDWIVLLYLIVKRVPRNYLSIFERWSKNITIIYIMHFAVLAVIIQFMPRSFDILGCIIIFLVLFAFVDYITMKIMEKRKSSGNIV